MFMDYPLIVSIVSTVTTAIVGVILSKQIKSQQTIIKNLNAYISTTNWKEVQKYYDEFKVPAEKDITRLQLINEYGKTPDEHENLIEDYNELLNYFHTVTKGLNELHPNFAKDRILTGLPRNAKYFRDIWEGD